MAMAVGAQALGFDQTAKDRGRKFRGYRQRIDDKSIANPGLTDEECGVRRISLQFLAQLADQHPETLRM